MDLKQIKDAKYELPDDLQSHAFQMLPEITLEYIDFHMTQQTQRPIKVAYLLLQPPKTYFGGA